MLIALEGRARSGKDTAAKRLCNAHNFASIPFADALKKSAAFKFGFALDDAYTQEGKDTFMPEWGLTIGEILQQEGSEATKPHWGNDFWVKRWRMTYDAYLQRGITNIVVPDCRFVLEAQEIHRLGGKVIRIDRPGVAALVGKRDPNHSSEQGLPDELIDLVVVNDGTITQLQDRILEAVRNWQ